MIYSGEVSLGYLNNPSHFEIPRLRFNKNNGKIVEPKHTISEYMSKVLLYKKMVVRKKSVKKKELYINVKKVIWLLKNKKNIKLFINNILNKRLNNETIGQSAEYSICLNAKIKCNIRKNRISTIIVNRLNKIIEKESILNKLPEEISESCGYKNGSIDFLLKNKETLSLKTLRFKDGKICPQQVGQPTLKSWDKYWKKKWEGALDKNPERWEFIKQNIHLYLNEMLRKVFCCDYLIILKNCIDNPSVTYYDKKKLNDKLKYFNDQSIIYTREKYEERWNERKNKYSEMSSTIKIDILGKLIKIGEFQFHKSSRKELKFRFWDEFLEKVF